MLAFLLWAQAVTSPSMHPVELMLDEARSKSSEELADLLLPERHPPVVWSAVHPTGMEPRVPWVTSVQLMTTPGSAREPGFCSAILYNVYFDSDGELGRSSAQPTPAWPTNITKLALYRLSRSGAPSAETCAGKPDAFFSVSPDRARESLTLVRLFAEARAASLQGKDSAMLSLDDQLGRRMEAYYREHRGDTAELTEEQRFHRITDPRAALAELPIDRIHSVSEENDFSISNEAKQARERAGSGAQVIEIGAGTTWKVEMVMQGNRVIALHIIRRIPPPF